MSGLKSGIVLTEGEKLVMEIEAELWATSSNPIAQLVGDIKKFIFKLLGSKVSGYLVITNKRVIEVTKKTRFYFFNVGSNVKYLLPNSIKEVGYSKRATFACCCPAYFFYYEGFTQITSILLRGATDIDAQKTVDAFYSAISNAQAGNV